MMFEHKSYYSFSVLVQFLRLRGRFLHFQHQICLDWSSCGPTPLSWWNTMVNQSTFTFFSQTVEFWNMETTAEVMSFNRVQRSTYLVFHACLCKKKSVLWTLLKIDLLLFYCRFQGTLMQVAMQQITLSQCKHASITALDYINEVNLFSLSNCVHFWI